MSRGPGHVERTIRKLLSEHPVGTFSTNEIIGACFPDQDFIMKKHRVSALRALGKVCYALGWTSEMISGQRGEFVIYNPFSLYSYAVGRTRAHERGDWSREKSRSQIISAEEAEAMLLGLDQGTRWRNARDNSVWIRADGPYPIAVGRNKALQAGDAERAEGLRAEYNRAVSTAIHLPDAITGDIHPDFLQDAALAA